MQQQIVFHVDMDAVKKVIEEIAADIYRSAKDEKYTFRTVVLKIRFEDFETHTRQKSFKDEPTVDKVKETGCAF